MSSTRAEKLWCTLVIENRSQDTLSIQNVQLLWGKFCSGGYGPCNEIPASDIDGKTVAPKKTYSIYTCGRQSAASGTEGSIDLYAKNEKVATIYWDCPWGLKPNVVSVRDVPTDWMVSNSQFGPDGAIGTVYIKTVYTG